MDYRNIKMASGHYVANEFSFKPSFFMMLKFMRVFSSSSINCIKILEALLQLLIRYLLNISG